MKKHITAIIMILTVLLTNLFAYDIAEVLKNGSISEIEKALDEYVNINFPINKFNLTPFLYVCTYNDNPEIIDLLIQKGANPYVRTKEGFTAIDLAALNNNVKLIKKLVKIGFDLNKRNGLGYSPFFYGVSAGTIETIETMIGLGAEINSRSKETLTPLHMAVIYNKDPEVVKLLINYGAKPKMRDGANKYPVDYADLNKNFIESAQYKMLKELTEIPENDCPNFKWGESVQNIQKYYNEPYNKPYPSTASDPSIKSYLYFDTAKYYDVFYTFDGENHLNSTASVYKYSFETVEEYYNKYIELRNSLIEKYGMPLDDDITWDDEAKNKNLSVEEGIKQSLIILGSTFLYGNTKINIWIDTPINPPKIYERYNILIKK